MQSCGVVETTRGWKSDKDEESGVEEHYCATDGMVLTFGKVNKISDTKNLIKWGVSRS